MFSVEAYDYTTGDQWSRWTRRIVRGQFVDGPHGPESLSATVRMNATEAAYWLRMIGRAHIQVFGRNGLRWAGRLSGVQTGSGHATIEARGPWDSLADLKYTCGWSASKPESWRILNSADISTVNQPRWEQTNRNGLIFTPRKNNQYDTSNKAAFGLRVPHNSTPGRAWQTLVFDYNINGDLLWKVEAESRSYGWGSTASLFTANGSLTPPVTGTATLTLGANANDALVILFYYNAASPVNFTGETGAVSCTITNIRAKTATAATVVASAVVNSVSDYVNTGNPTMLEDVIGLVQSPGIDWYDLAFTDIPCQDAIKAVTPDGWECGVTAERQMYLRPEGTFGRTWHVVGTLQVGRALEDVKNASRVGYSHIDGEMRRTSAVTSTASLAQFGVRREIFDRTDGTNETEANEVRDTLLSAHAQPDPRLGVTIRRLYAESQGIVPRRDWSEIRPGDAVYLMNAPAEWNSAEKLATAIVRNVTCDLVTGNVRLEVDPIASLPYLVAAPAPYRHPLSFPIVR